MRHGSALADADAASHFAERGLAVGASPRGDVQAESVWNSVARVRTATATWLIGFTVATLALCGLPYLLARAFGPPDLEFIGTFWFNHDFSQYEAAMREGARSTSWLIHDHFSAESHPAILMYPLYVAAGKLAALFGLGDQTAFAALEWLGRLSVLGALYAFAATFVHDVKIRRLALVLAIGTLGLDVWGAGLRLLFEALHATVLAQLLPAEVNPYLEVSSFGVLLSAPHLMFGLALTLLAAPLYLRAISADETPRSLVGTGVTDGAAPIATLLLAADVALLSLVHSFNTPVLASVLAVHALLTGRRAWPAGIAAILAAMPMTLYSALVFSRDPFWSATYGAQNEMPSPAPWALPFDYGLVLLAAPLAWPIVRRWPAERRWLILLWIGLGLAWMYAPVAFQRRLSFGVQPALAVLSAVGLVHANAWLRARRASGLQRRAFNYVVALAAASTSLLVYLSLLASAAFDRPTPVYLWTRAEAQAGAWLGNHSGADDVVLAATNFANPLAGDIDGRVFQGHNVATLDNRRKEQAVWRFYAADTTAAERAQTLEASGVTVVALGPAERALGAGADALDGLPGLERVYDGDGVALFRVSR
jgi:hypothetical protein